MATVKKPATKVVTGRERLQELYRHLEHYSQGDRHMAYYGQLRAEGQDHDDALEETIVHFGLREREWYQRRFTRDEKEER